MKNYVAEKISKLFNVSIFMKRKLNENKILLSKEMEIIEQFV